MNLRRSIVPIAALVGLLAAAAPASATSPSGVVISKLRTRTAASPYDEYVEIHNTSPAAVDLSGWRLYDCYQSSGTQRVGTDGDPLAQGTTLPAGATFVFGKDIGDYSGTSDATYNFQVTETGGFQLRDSHGTIQDGAGAPGTACAEGSGLSFPTSGSDFTFTRSGPDTDENAADFGAPSGSADGTACGAACEAPPTNVAIDQVQGRNLTTSMSGRRVSITGVVTGVDNQQGVSNYVNLDPRQAGIYVQATTPGDADPKTSEGIFVGGLDAADRAASHIGQLVTVSGTAGELYNLTWIDATGRAPMWGGPAPLPEPVTIDPAQAAAQTVHSNGARDLYESLEGMRVRLDVGTADSGGTDKFGELFLRPGPDRDRVFRDPAQTGPPELLDLGQDAGSADVDPTNPSATPASSTRVDADLFDRVHDVVGPLGFAFSQYQIQPQPGAMPTIEKGPIEYPPAVPDAAPHTLRVANFNVENLFAAGMVDDGHTFTQDEVDAHTNRIADAIRIMHQPDVIAVEEVADPAPLREAARKAGDYRAIWYPSTDARHVAVGFLVREGVQADDVRQLGRDATTTAKGCNDDGSDNPKTFERPPLAVDIKRGPISFTIIGNHWGSQGHPEACREAQAAFVHDQAVALEAAGKQVIVTGDLNDFEDSPALTQDLVAPGTSLTNLWSLAPADDRYSYQYSGQLQTLDHIFVTEGLRRDVSDFRYVHFDNDYHERDPFRDAPKVSDHDSPLATFTWGGGSH